MSGPATKQTNILLQLTAFWGCRKLILGMVVSFGRWTACPSSVYHDVPLDLLRASDLEHQFYIIL